MKKILFTILWYFLVNINNISADEITPNQIIPDEYNNAIEIWEGKKAITNIFDLIKESIFWLLALISIAVFIFIWARLIMAQWNPEEFKKALMQFIYAIVWLAVIAISWGAVKLVSSLNF